MSRIGSTYKTEEARVSTLLAKWKMPQACQGIQYGLVPTIGQWCHAHLNVQENAQNSYIYNNGNLQQLQSRGIEEDSSVRWHVTTKTTASLSCGLYGDTRHFSSRKDKGDAFHVGCHHMHFAAK